MPAQERSAMSRPSDENQCTLRAYEEHASEYARTAGHVTAGVKAWLDESAAGLSAAARILELGSATGRDASYLRSLGYAVECTDATAAFVALLQDTGLGARQLNVITDDLGGPYDLVLANAVLLHLTRGQLQSVLHKIRKSLGERGRLAFTLKRGKGEEWSNAKLGAPRFFCYWEAGPLRGLLATAGFTDARITGCASVRAPSDGRPAIVTDWLHIVATGAASR
jgi:predicted TPR repeat methyltransferase